MTVLAITCLYETRLWWRNARPATPPSRRPTRDGTMTATTPSCWRAAGRPNPAWRPGPGRWGGGAVLLVMTRVGLWLGVQLWWPAC